MDLISAHNDQFGNSPIYQINKYTKLTYYGFMAGKRRIKDEFLNVNSPCRSYFLCAFATESGCEKIVSGANRSQNAINACLRHRWLDLRERRLKSSLREKASKQVKHWSLTHS